MMKYFTWPLIESVISLLVVIISAVWSTATDLPTATDRKSRSKRIRKIQLVFGTVVFGLISLAILFDNHVRSTDTAANIKTQNIADSIKREIKSLADSRKIDSLLKANNDLQIKLDTVGSKLTKVKTTATDILITQTERFKTTSIKIQNTADSLSKYLLGVSGVVFLTLEQEKPGRMSFAINNSEHYALHPVQIIVCHYSSLDSCTSWAGPVKYLSMKLLISKSIINVANENIPPGKEISPLHIKLESGEKQRFLAYIQVGSVVYIEELIAYTQSGTFAYRLFRPDPDKHKVLISMFMSPLIYHFDWDEEFHFKWENLRLHRD